MFEIDQKRFGTKFLETVVALTPFKGKAGQKNEKKTRGRKND